MNDEISNVQHYDMSCYDKAMSLDLYMQEMYKTAPFQAATGMLGMSLGGQLSVK